MLSFILQTPSGQVILSHVKYSSASLNMTGPVHKTVISTVTREKESLAGGGDSGGRVGWDQTMGFFFFP